MYKSDKKEFQELKIQMWALLTGFIFVFSLGNVACQSKTSEDIPSPTSPIPFKSQYSIQGLGVSTSFVDLPISKGPTDLSEVSGMAYSVTNPGFIWVHQDSGDGAIVYLIDASNAATVASYSLTGFTNRDWEDIEIGPGPILGKSYLYIGETGDNEQKYGDYAILRLEEPKFQEQHRGKLVAISTGVELISFKYPTKNHDVECLLVDPLTKNIYLVTKRDFFAKVFEMAYPQSPDAQNAVQEVGTFPFTIVTGGAVSRDGLRAAVKTYDRIFYWTRLPGQSFVDMLASTPSLLPYKREDQGEAICFDPNGGYFTLSEKANEKIPELFFYSKR